MSIHLYIQKTIKYSAYTACIFLLSVLIFIGSFFVFMHFDVAENKVRQYMEEKGNAFLAPYAIHLKIGKISLNLPFSIAIHKVDFSDAHGNFASTKNSIINYDFFALFRYAFVISDISLQEIRLMRVPQFTMPQDESTKAYEKPLKAHMQDMLETITSLLFHKYMPALHIEKIELLAIIQSSLLEQLSKQMQKTNNANNVSNNKNKVLGNKHYASALNKPVIDKKQTSTISNSTNTISNSTKPISNSIKPISQFQDSILTATLSIDLNSNRFTANSIMSLSRYDDKDSTVHKDLTAENMGIASIQNTDKQLGKQLDKNAGTSLSKIINIKTSLNILKNQEIQIHLDLQDKEGLSLDIVKEILDMPLSKKAHANFSMEGSGSLEAFLMKYETSIYDMSFMSAPAIAKGNAQLFPFFANIDLSVYPAISTIIDTGVFSLKAKIEASKTAAMDADIVKKDTDLAKKDTAIAKNDTDIATNDAKHITQKMHMSYTFSSHDVHFAQQVLQGLLGDKQSSQGQLNIILSPYALPHIETDNIFFKAKTFQASAKARISQDVDIKIQASLPDLSILSTQKQKIQGSVKADITMQGSLNDISIHTSLSIPRLDIRIIKPKISVTSAKNKIASPKKEINKVQNKTIQKQKINIQNSQDILLNSLLFSLKSIRDTTSLQQDSTSIKDIEDKQNNIKNTQIEDEFKIHAPSYLAGIARFRKLIAENTQYMYSIFIDFSTQYNNEGMHLRSELVFSEGILQKIPKKPRNIQIKDLSFKGFDGEAKGNLDFTWHASKEIFSDFKKIPLISGTIQGSWKNSQRLTQVIGMPLQVENMKFMGNFSTSEILTENNKPNESKNESYRNFISSLAYSSPQNISFQFSSTSLGYDDILLDKIEANIAVKNIWFFPLITAKADIQAINYGSFMGKKYALQLNGSLNDLKIKTSLKGDALFDFTGELAWNRAKQEYLLNMVHLSLQYPAINMDINLEQKGQIYLSGKEFRAKTINFSVAPKGNIKLDGFIKPNAISFQALWKNIDLSTFPLKHKGITEGSLPLKGSSQKPMGNLKASIRDLQVKGMPPLSFDIKGSIITKNLIHRLAIELDFVNKEQFEAKKAHLSLDIPLESKPFLRIARDIPLQGSLIYDGNIASFWQYVPSERRRLTGILQIKGDVSGYILQPQLSLMAKMSNARYEDIISGILITDIQTQLTLDKDGKGIIDFSCKDAKNGTISIKGSMEVPLLMYGKYKAPISIKDKKPNTRELKVIKAWENSAAILDLVGEIKSFEPLQRNDIQLTLSSKFYIQGMLEDPTIKGRIDIDKGSINLKNVKAAPIPALNIVEDSSKKPKRKIKNIGNLNVQINIPDNFYVYAPFFFAEWKGDLNIKGTPAMPELSGTIAAIRGGITLFGKTFKLSKGNIYFDGSNPIAPVADVQLSYTSKGFAALLGIRGTSHDLQLELSSVPNLPQDEILARVLFSSSMTKLSAFEKIQLATALTRLAGFSISNGISNIGRKLIGLDVLRINTSSEYSDSDDEKYSVEVGKYMGETLYIGMEQGIDSQETEGLADWQFDDNWSTGTRFGTEDAQINLEWKYDY